VYETERDNGSGQKHDHMFEKRGCHELVYTRATTMARNEQPDFAGSIIIIAENTAFLRIHLRTQGGRAKLKPCGITFTPSVLSRKTRKVGPFFVIKIILPGSLVEYQTWGKWYPIKDHPHFWGTDELM
jgi:hypothetical protein